MSKDPPAIVRMPAYLSGFGCLGPACEDNCCYGWDIVVDQASYQRYRRLKSTRLQTLFKKSIKRQSHHPTETDYARILRKEDRCLFLAEDGLCRIQTELGEDFLPDVCAVFPRQLRARGKAIEITASLACPQIAHLALENPAGIELVEAPLDPAAARKLRAVQPATSGEAEDAGFKLRELALWVLKDRRRELRQRMLMLGFLIDSASRADPSAISLLVDSFSREMDSAAVRDLVEEAPALTGLQLQIVKRLNDEKVKSVRVKAFLDCIRECFAGLGYPEGQGFTEEIGGRYDLACRLFFRPFLHRCGHMLENCMVNYLLHHDLCFQQGRRLYTDYVTMVLHFAMIKTYLIGMAAFHGENFTPALATRLIYSFTKALEPDAAFKNYALGLLEESGCTDMMSMAVLIKN